MERLPGSGISLQPEGMLEKWTLIWACFYPPAALELPGFSQACPLSKGGRWDLGDCPRPGVERRAPIPHPGCGEFWSSCRPAGGSVTRKGWVFASCTQAP